MTTAIDSGISQGSTAHILIPPLAPADATVEQDKLLFDAFEMLKHQAGPNKHDAVTVLIQACILEGIDTGPAIIAHLKRHGFHAQHIGIMLKAGTGRDPARHAWWRGDDNRYHLHSPQNQPGEAGRRVS